MLLLHQKLNTTTIGPYSKRLVYYYNPMMLLDTPTVLIKQINATLNENEHQLWLITVLINLNCILTFIFMFKDYKLSLLLIARKTKNACRRTTLRVAQPVSVFVLQAIRRRLESCRRNSPIPRAIRRRIQSRDVYLLL